MKDLVFLYKKMGLREALYYFFYKLKFKLHGPKAVNETDKRIGRIYETLSRLKYGSAIIDGKEYIQRPIPGAPNQHILLRPDSSDTKVFEQVFINNQYKCVYEIFTQFFSDPDTIFDCGANIGLTSVYFNLLYPSAHYIAIEPFRDNILLARLNFEKAGLQNLTVIEGGVWNRDIPLSINREFRDGKEWSVSLTDKRRDDHVINGHSLVALVDREDVVDILKIDIEGAEAVLFSDIDYARGFLKKVKCIAIEIHDEFKIRQSVYEALTASGFFYFNNNELTIGINRTYL